MNGHGVILTQRLLVVKHALFIANGIVVILALLTGPDILIKCVILVSFDNVVFITTIKTCLMAHARSKNLGGVY